MKHLGETHIPYLLMAEEETRDVSLNTNTTVYPDPFKGESRLEVSPLKQS